MTDEELSLAIRETYRRIMARERGDTERALTTCEELLRVQRGTAGRSADRMLIARMLAEEPLGSTHSSNTP